MHNVCRSILIRQGARQQMLMQAWLQSLWGACPWEPTPAKGKAGHVWQDDVVMFLGISARSRPCGCGRAINRPYCVQMHASCDPDHMK